MKTLEEHSIESRLVWKPMHMQPVFEKCSFYTVDEKRPFSEIAFETGLCLPSGSSLTEEKQSAIIDN